MPQPADYLPRGTVAYKPEKNHIRYRVAVTMEDGSLAVKDSSIKLQPNPTKRQIKDAEERAQQIIDAYVQKVLGLSTAPTHKKTSADMSGYTVKQWVEYIDKNHSWASSTKRSRSIRINAHVIPRFGDLSIAYVTTVDVQNFVQDLERSGMGFYAVRNVHSDMRSYFSQAVRLKVLKENPCNGVVLDESRKPAKEKRWLLPDEIKKVLSVCSLQERALIKQGLFLGARKGELFGTTWAHIDLEREWMRIFGEVVNTEKGDRYEERSKSDDSDRTVPVPKELLEDLKQLPRGKFVYPNSKGKFIDSTTANDLIASIVERAEIEKSTSPDQQHLKHPTWHTLRHSFATYLEMAGCDDFHKDYLLGHGQKTVRGQHYQQPLASVLKRVINDVVAFMLGEKKLTENDESIPRIR